MWASWPHCLDLLTISSRHFNSYCEDFTANSLGKPQLCNFPCLLVHSLFFLYPNWCFAFLWYSNFVDHIVRITATKLLTVTQYWSRATCTIHYFVKKTIVTIIMNPVVHFSVQLQDFHNTIRLQNWGDATKVFDQKDMVAINHTCLTQQWNIELLFRPRILMGFSGNHITQ